MFVGLCGVMSGDVFFLAGGVIRVRCPSRGLGDVYWGQGVVCGSVGEVMGVVWCGVVWCGCGCGVVWYGVVSVSYKHRTLPTILRR